MQKRITKKNHLSAQTQLNRNTMLNRTLALSLLSLVLIATLSLGCFRIWSQAQAKDEVQLYKYYTSIEVEYGDTMWDIASRYCSRPYNDYNAYINEVMRINRMLEPEIKAGNTLIVPYYSSELK